MNDDIATVLFTYGLLGGIVGIVLGLVMIWLVTRK